MTATTCQATVTAHHSDDRVTVHHGAAQPVTLCGYHAQPVWLADALASVVEPVVAEAVNGAIPPSLQAYLLT